VLPVARYTSIALPTPMSTAQAHLPIKLAVYDKDGKQVHEHKLGNLKRSVSVAIVANDLVKAALPGGYGHMELTYDFDAGEDADGWLHALFRFHDRETGHSAETSFGEIVLGGVRGDARAKSQHGSVTATDVGGGLVVETTHGGVELDRVSGPVEVTVEHGGVEARELRGTAKVRAQDGEVSIHGFGGGLDVAVAMGGGPYHFVMPRVTSVWLTGRLRPWVSA